jgi:hypothetical protein
MTHKFTTKFGRNFEIDLNQWSIDEENRSCKIIERSEGNVLLENRQNENFSIPEHLIEANDLDVMDNKVELTQGLYENWFLKKYRERTNRLLDELFKQYASDIFQNRDLVLSKPEYYLLMPNFLSSGFMYIGGVSYTLGTLFESMESGKHIYYDTFLEYRKMYLVSMGASPLSGSIFKAIFWSDESRELVRFDSKSALPGNFGTSAGHALIEMLRDQLPMIDRQDIAISNLIKEIKALER